MESASPHKKKPVANKKNNAASLSDAPLSEPARQPGRPISAGTELTPSANLFPVVGIGASAGGLDAFKKLLKAIPENSGMAYVLVQHLNPSHESLLPELLQKVTTTPVLEITDDIKVEPDHIYIIPSNKMLIANDGKLELSPRPAKSATNKNQLNLPIDLFFASLAEVHQSHAIGVVLSGTASDGTHGLKAIKDHGGITIAQDQASAAYNSMPNSAVRAGVVDFILPPEQIPQKLMEITRRINGNNNEQTISQTDEELFKQILSLLRIRKAIDFTYYKQTTIRRRILRRMLLNKNDDLAEYLQYLRANKPEQDMLYQDLLIPVTGFFRDAKTWDNLYETAFPKLIKTKPVGEPIRIWVAGCSTGEEAYSMAICINEFLGDKQDRVQIFASDISEQAIAKARLGIYTKSDVEAISPQRLKEFFTENNGGYQVNKRVRDTCVFAVHNFLKDPPFGKMDIISCRNVLIYMEAYLQKKALTTFHYALNPKGFLLLGKSETVSSVAELFTNGAPGDKKEKLFTRKEGTGRLIPVVSRQTEETLGYSNAAGGKNEMNRTDFQKTADDIILSKYTPAGVVVNEAMDIVHFRGSTSPWLEQAPGKPSFNVIKMAKNGLGFELRNMLHKVKKDKTAVIKENVPVKVNGSQRIINIEAIPLLNLAEPHYLILFHDKAELRSEKPEVGGRKSTAKRKSDEKDLQIQQLEKELAQMRDDMRSITEDQEAVNEALQSANEELLSGSEELQSLNEELETSKEELQSTNEELTVVNQELIALNEQVTAERNYSEAIVNTVRDSLLVLDKNLRIKFANRNFYKTFLVNEPETEGELLYNLGNKQWNIPELRTLLEVLLAEKENFFDYEVSHYFQSIGQRTMLLNAREIVNGDSTERLILLAIEDITGRKQAEYENSLLGTIVDSSEDAIISETLGGIITSWNKGAEKIFGYGPAEAIGENIRMLIPPEIKQEEKMVISKIKKGQAVLHYDTVRLSKESRRINISLTVSPIKNKKAEITGASIIARDITEQIIARKQIEKSEKRYTDMIMQSQFGFAMLRGKDMVVTLANDSVKEMWGKEKNNIEGKPLLEVLPEIKDQGFPALFSEVFTTGIPYYGTQVPARLLRRGKMEDVYFNFVYQPHREADESISGINIIAVEVTAEVEMNKKIKESEANFRQLAELMPDKVSNADAQGNIIYYNQHWLNYTGFNFEELKDGGWKKIIWPDDLPEFTKRWQHSLATGDDFEMELRIINANGEPKWHLSRSVAIRDDSASLPDVSPGGYTRGQGKITKWIATTTDIDDQKMKEQQKDEFIGIASHEMKTPLTTAKAYIQLLQQSMEQTNDKHLFFAQKANASINRLNNLIGELLDVSKIKHGKLALNIAPFNFNEMVAMAIESAQIVSSSHSIVQSGAIDEPVTGDKERLEQVIINLLSNAAKYSPQADKIFITVAKENQEVKVAVKDSGIGIRKENFKKIFERYYRESNSQFQGLGIGLSICYEIILRHKGKIWVQSEPGKGSTFYFTIPISI